MREGKILPRGWKAVDVIILDDLVRIHDDGNEERQDNVDEETDEGVEINSTVNPDGSKGEKNCILKSLKKGGNSQ